MPNLIKQGETRVITKNGEVFVNIALELTIKLDGSELKISSSSNPENKEAFSKNQDEKVNWAIPDFTSDKIQFGK